MPYQPNRTTTALINRLTKAGIDVLTATEPDQGSYPVDLFRGRIYVGSIRVGAQSGRLVRGIVPRPRDTSEIAHKPKQIIALFDDLTGEVHRG